jgi:hypothetical protein
MSASEKEEVILEEYRTRVDDLRAKMHFYSFENNRCYSFDYHFKSQFNQIITDFNKVCEEKKISPSPYITNHIPIFLPTETKRIAFFIYRSKSVREVNIDDLEILLIKQAQKHSRSGAFPFDEIQKKVEEDLKTFKEYDSSHDFDGYRRDTLTNTIQFNAYDKNDKLIIEKSFVRGGLVFNMQKAEFIKKINVSYPGHRKQRSDKKNDYLPLKLIKIRGILLASTLPSA